MADRVIISGVSRQGKIIDISELKQMEGRAGRKQGSEDCYCDYVLSDTDEEAFSSKYLSDDGLIVSSAQDEYSLAFQVIPFIANGTVTSFKKLEEWYSRSLHSFQGHKIDLKVVEDILQTCDAVRIVKDRYYMSIIGEISHNFYFNPTTVFVLKENFEELFNCNGEHRDDYIAYALADIPYTGYRFGSQNFNMRLSEFNSFSYEHGNTSAGLLWYLAMNEERITGTSGVIGQMKKDFGRLIQVLRILNDACDWNMGDFFTELEFRIAYRAPRDLVQLIMIPGIGKTCAYALRELDVTSLEGIINNKEFILNNLDGRTRAIVKGVIDDHEK